jgi:hypothetical protein
MLGFLIELDLNLECLDELKDIKVSSGFIWLCD